MLKAALKHTVQQNKQEIKLGQILSNQGHNQPSYLLEQSENYFYWACLLNLPCFIIAFRNPFKGQSFYFNF